MPRPDTHIPVTVLPKNPRPTPSIPLVQPAPVPPPTPTTPKKVRPAPRPRTEAERRRLMWLIVLLGSLLALVGLVLLWPLQMKNGKRDTLIQKIVETLSSRRTTTETPGQKEIRSLDKQVFPQFQ